MGGGSSPGIPSSSAVSAARTWAAMSKRGGAPSSRRSTTAHWASFPRARPRGRGPATTGRDPARLAGAAADGGTGFRRGHAPRGEAATRGVPADHRGQPHARPRARGAGLGVGARQEPVRGGVADRHTRLRGRERTVEKVLDARGLKCPMPIFKAKKELETLGIDDVLKVLATDKGSVLDM